MCKVLSRAALGKLQLTFTEQSASFCFKLWWNPAHTPEFDGVAGARSFA